MFRSVLEAHYQVRIATAGAERCSDISIMGGGQSGHEDESMDNAHEASRYLAAVSMLDFFSSATGTDVEMLFRKLAFRP